VDAVLVPRLLCRQLCCRAEHILQAGGQPQVAGVHDHELPGQAKLLAKIVLLRQRAHDLRVGPDRDQRDLPGRHALALQVSPKALRNHRYMRRVPVEKALHCRKESDQAPVAQHPGRDCGVRVKILQLEHPGYPPKAAQEPRGQPQGQRRRVTHDDVRPAREQSTVESRCAVGAIVQQPRPECLARRDMAPRAHNPHAIQPLHLVGTVAVAREHAAVRIVWRTGNERDLVPPPDQVGGKLGDQHRRTDILRRITLGHEHDAHLPQSPLTPRELRARWPGSLAPAFARPVPDCLPRSRRGAHPAPPRCRPRSRCPDRSLRP